MARITRAMYFQLKFSLTSLVCAPSIAILDRRHRDPGRLKPLPIPCRASGSGNPERRPAP